jgi:hypothetical protein
MKDSFLGGRGTSRRAAWVEQIQPVPGYTSSVVFVEYAYWRGGAELRARSGVDGRLLGIVPTIPHYWLTGDHLSVQEQAMRFLKKVTAEEQGKKATACAEHAAWRESYPALAEYMEADQWPDGTARKTSTLLVFCEAGCVKGCLNDRDGGRSLWSTSDSLAALLASLEAMLATGTGEWRQSGYASPTQKGPKARR